MRILYISLICLLCCSIADAHNWPMFQQDLRNSGFSPSKMPEHLRKVWINEEYGLVAGISTNEGKLFLTKLTSLSALDINTGAVLWNVLPEGILFLICSPTVAENRLYITGTQGVFCLDADTGEVVWKYEVKRVNLYSSPIVVGNHVIVGGGEPWEPDAVEYAKRVLCLDAETGEFVWEFFAHDFADSSPTYFNGRIYLNDGGRTVYCLEEQTGELIWEKEIEWVNFSSLSLDEERIFTGTSSGIICLQQETGEMLWKFDCGEMIFTTPAVAYNKIFFGTPEGVFYCLDAQNGEVIWKIETGNTITCPAVVADRKVAFGTNDGTLYIVNAESGKILESYNLGDTIAVLALSDGKLFVGQDRGRITCFEESLLEKYAVLIGAAIALFVVLLIVIKWKKSA